MKAPTKLAAAMTVILSITPATSGAQARGPVPIREETPGLISQARISQAQARLAAFGEFPGAQMVAAEIGQQGDRLVFSFDFNYAGREGNEKVLIDAATAHVVSVEYTVDPDPRQHLVTTASPELVSLVESSFAAARTAAGATAEKARVLRCRLRVEQTRTVYVFELAVGDGSVPQQALIDASTGAVVPALQPG